MTPIKLGNRVRDRITGFEGIAVIRWSMLINENYIAIQPDLGPNGEYRDCATIDEFRIEYVGDGIAYMAVPLDPCDIKICDVVVDYVTQVQGIVTGIMLNISGCVHLIVESVYDEKSSEVRKITADHKRFKKLKGFKMRERVAVTKGVYFPRIGMEIPLA